MRTSLLLLLLGLVGCGSNSPQLIPPTDDDFVSNDNGVGTAQVFGINFRVNVNSSGASSDNAFHLNFIEPDESSAKKRFTIGDEITIQLDSIDETQVHFVFNDQDFGVLEVGDEVVIDDARNVEVNGAARGPLATE